MASNNVTKGIQIEGLNETLRAFSRYGKDANKALRQATVEIAKATAEDARTYGTGLGPMQRLAAESIKARSDRVPKIVGGGSKRAGSRRNPVGAFFLGAEFGGRGRATTQMFQPHRGRRGYFMWPTIKERANDDLKLYLAALNKLAREWSSGG